MLARRFVRRWRLLLTLATVVAVAAVAVLLALPVTRDTPDTPGVIVLTPGAESLNCVRDASWSPDGRYFALLGYAGGCPESRPGTASSGGRIVVYDAATGAVHTSLAPDAAVLDALHAETPAAGAMLIQYQTLLWRPDGARLAVAFSLTATQTNAPSPQLASTVLGLILAPVNGSRPTVFTHPLAAGEDAAGEWNLRTGAYLAQPVALPPPALSYTWSSAGTFAPAAGAAASGNIGQPAGGNSFTIWQPAQIVRESASITDTTSPAVYVYRTSFAGWSPDGTYFAPSLGITARIQPAGQPTPDQHMLAALGVSSLRPLPVRDAALSTALGQLTLLTADRTNGPMSVSWSPSGRILAVQLIPADPNADSSRTDHAIILYDSATGKPLTALVPRIGPRRLSGNTVLRWSPDGARLLLYDPVLGTVMIWSGANIPRA